MPKSTLPPFDDNGFYMPDGKPHPGACYGPPDPPRHDEVETAVAYLSRLRPTKHPTHSSYYLKHCAEEWGQHNGHSNYVSNGALIAAAVQLGLSITPDNINAGIGVSKRDVKALQEEKTS